MYIEKVLYYSKEDQEAEVYVSDGNYTLLCYAYPIRGIHVMQEVRQITTFGSNNLHKSTIKAIAIEKLSDYYGYYLTGQIASKNENTVKIGNIIMQIDGYIPSDVVDGDHVSFSVERLDLTI